MGKKDAKDTKDMQATESTKKADESNDVKVQKADALFRVVMNRDCACGEGEIKAGEELCLIKFTHESAQTVPPLYLVHALGSDLAHIEAVEE